MERLFPCVSWSSSVTTTGDHESYLQLQESPKIFFYKNQQKDVLRLSFQYKKLKNTKIRKTGVAHRKNIAENIAVCSSSCGSLPILFSVATLTM